MFHKKWSLFEFHCALNLTSPSLFESLLPNSSIAASRDPAAIKRRFGMSLIGGEAGPDAPFLPAEEIPFRFTMDGAIFADRVEWTVSQSSSGSVSTFPCSSRASSSSFWRSEKLSPVEWEESELRWEGSSAFASVSLERCDGVVGGNCWWRRCREDFWVAKVNSGLFRRLASWRNGRSTWSPEVVRESVG